MIDKPGAPLGLKIDAIGNDWIELTWEPPIKDGGSPITGYVVERRTAANYKWHVSVIDVLCFVFLRFDSIVFKGSNGTI